MIVELDRLWIHLRADLASKRGFYVDDGSRRIVAPGVARILRSGGTSRKSRAHAGRLRDHPYRLVDVLRADADWLEEAMTETLLLRDPRGALVLDGFLDELEVVELPGYGERVDLAFTFLAITPTVLTYEV